MDRIEYIIQLQNTLNLATLVCQLRLGDLLTMMNRSETIAPIIDPTLFLRGSKNLGKQKEIVEAALTFQQAIKKIDGI
jgi:hypothetical protein